MNIAMIDTLEVSFDISPYDDSLSEFLDLIEQKKQFSIMLREDGIDKHATVTLDNEIFEVYPNGTKNQAYILHSPSLEIRFAKARAKK